MKLVGSNWECDEKYSCAVSSGKRLQGQEALSWKGSGEMSQEEEPRNKTAQQMWCVDLGNTSGHTKCASHTAQLVL